MPIAFKYQQGRGRCNAASTELSSRRRSQAGMPSLAGAAHKPDRSSAGKLCAPDPGESHIAAPSMGLSGPSCATWTTPPECMHARMLAPQNQRSLVCRCASSGTRNLKRGASAKAAAITLAAEVTWAARIGNMTGSVIRTGYPLRTPSRMTFDVFSRCLLKETLQADVSLMGGLSSHERSRGVQRVALCRGAGVFSTSVRAGGWEELRRAGPGRAGGKPR